MEEPVKDVRTLVVGAGEAGRMAASEMAARPEHGYVVVGFLDDDPAKQGRTIAGAPVLGAVPDLAVVCEAQQIQEIVIAIPSASGRTIREVVRLCEDAGVSFKIVPGVWEIILGDVEISQIRKLELSDLLGRETVQLDTEKMTDYLRGRSVLITGAGGSIGSELARLVAGFEPGKLVLMGRGENSIFEIDRELAMEHPDMPRVPVIGSVSNAVAVERLFAAHKPDIVFHAAAHKHVHFMEFFPDEAIRNNVTGTRRLIEAAERHGAERLVMLSTDKAVRPRGVMGASKRLAELVMIGKAAVGAGTKLIAVRFGNVLGSRGSVVPMFTQQVRLGGPVTVTHPDVTRYFMTIREAAMLVLQAGLGGRGGEIFVLDMGDPIRIAELAEHIIRLSGLEPGTDIAIEYCGLRPGEKLHEELWSSSETLDRTEYDKIMVLRSNDTPGDAAAATAVSALEEMAERGDREGILHTLRDLFPGMAEEDSNG
jgi:FlaA1/EpsC-like NDP-sugar epimerase